MSRYPDETRVWVCKLVDTVKKKRLPSPSATRSSDAVAVMFTAPENMRSVGNDDDPIFDPVLVSIGPFHHNKFPAMEEHKTRILLSMLSRHANEDRSPEDLLLELVKFLESVEVKIRGCYSKEFGKINFVKMMICDGCFILEMFRMHAAGLYTQDGDDPIFMTRWMLPALALDMAKLENQLPYFVLEGLYKITRMPDEPQLNHLAGKFLVLLCPGLDNLAVTNDRSQDHLLALFHSTFIREENCRHIPIDRGNCNSFPSVTDLCLSGIKVVKKEPSTKRWNLLDIEYRNRKLEIPTLTVDHSTNMLMTNFVAYEQCNKMVPSIFTSYVTFIDALVNSAEDVEVLRAAGVINQFMNSNEEVSKLLNNLTASIKYDMNEGYLADINKRVYSDHHSAMPQLRARFKRLVNSREGIIYVVTLFALYLTVLQSVFAVLAYVHPLWAVSVGEILICMGLLLLGCLCNRFGLLGSSPFT